MIQPMMSDTMTNTTYAVATLPPQTTSAGNIVLTLPPEKITGLLQTVMAQTTSVSGTPIIQLASAYTGEGAETIGFEMAFAASQTGKKVLFIDTGARSRFAVLPVTHRQAITLHGLLSDQNLQISPFLTFSGTNFFFTTLAENPDSNLLFPNRDHLRGLLQDLKGQFDLIVIQTEGAMTAQAVTTVAGLADASVMVIEAERTRLPVARQLRQMIEDNGGKVLGATLNKRRLYIWKPIYDLLFRS